MRKTGLVLTLLIVIGILAATPVIADAGGLPSAPDAFSVVMGRTGEITGNFTKTLSTDTVLVRVKLDAYPANLTDGYEVFNSSVGYSFVLPGLTDALYADGIDATANFFSSPVWMSRIKYSAWARNDFGDSPTYTEATLGGSETAPMTAALEPAVSAMADFIASLAFFVALLFVALLNILAFRENDPFLYVLATPVNFTFGLYYASTSTLRHEFIIGVVVAIIGVFCLFKAVQTGLEKARINNRRLK